MNMLTVRCSVFQLCIDRIHPRISDKSSRRFYTYPSGLIHWHYGKHTIISVQVQQPSKIWVNISYKITKKSQYKTKQYMQIRVYILWNKLYTVGNGVYKAANSIPVQADLAVSLIQSTAVRQCIKLAYRNIPARSIGRGFYLTIWKV